MSHLLSSCHLCVWCPWHIWNVTWWCWDKYCQHFWGRHVVSLYCLTRDGWHVVSLYCITRDGWHVVSLYCLTRDGWHVVSLCWLIRDGWLSTDPIQSRVPIYWTWIFPENHHLQVASVIYKYIVSASLCLVHCGVHQTQMIWFDCSWVSGGSGWGSLSRYSTVLMTLGTLLSW